MLNVFGMPVFTQDELSQMAGMGSPVWCTFCGTVYDLQGVEVVVRHAECSVYYSPCCGKFVDSREWVSLPAFRRLRD